MTRGANYEITKPEPAKEQAAALNRTSCDLNAGHKVSVSQPPLIPALVPKAGHYATFNENRKCVNCGEGKYANSSKVCLLCEVPNPDYRE